MPDLPPVPVLRRLAAPGSRPGPSDATWRLVCFPHAGGAASWYRRLAVPPAAPGHARRRGRRVTGHDLGAPDVVGVQYPGRESRWAHEPARTMADLVDDVAPALARLLGDGVPTVVLGHSLGAAVAVETTARLVREGAPPAVLALSGRAAPGTRVHTPVPRDDDGLRAWVLALGGTPPGLLDDPEVLGLVTRPLRADLDVHDAWDGHDARIDVPLVLLAGRDDPAARPIEVGAWAGRARAGARFEELDGGHFFLDEHAPRVVGTLRDALAATLAARVEAAS